MPVVKVRIGPADQGRTMTLEEFRRAEEQPGYLYELARGVLEVGEVPDDDHGQVVHNIHEAISLYGRRRRSRIRRIAHGSDVRLVIPELKSDRHPDLAIIFRTAPINARGRQIPEWVCEVVSPGARARRRDYQQKSEEYLALGVREYWIVDLRDRKVTVRVRVEGPKGPAWSDRVFAGDEVIASILLPGFQGTVSELWLDAGLEDGDGR
jgi:Uma2 family endonuclease